MLNIFSPSSGGLGVCTLVVQICRKKKKFSSSESLRMALKPTRLPKAFGSLYRVDALICDIRDWGFILFRLCFWILLHSVFVETMMRCILQRFWKLFRCDVFFNLNKVLFYLVKMCETLTCFNNYYIFIRKWYVWFRVLHESPQDEHHLDQTPSTSPSNPPLRPVIWMCGTKACPQWGDAANRTHHQVSLSSPQTEGGNSKSPRATSPQRHKSDRGQSCCSWYP